MIEKDCTKFKSVENFVYNGINIEEEFTDASKDEYLIVNSVYGRGLLGAEHIALDVPFVDGSYIEHSRLTPRIITISMTLKADSFEALRGKILKLSSVLTYKNDVEISFNDEPNLVYYGRYAGLSDEFESSKKAQVTFDILCSDPHKYAKKEVSYDIAGGLTTLNNKGTANAKPILELTATKDTTFALIENQFEEYMLLGYPLEEEGQEQIVDDRVSVMFEDGSTLSSWSTTNYKVDTNFNDVRGSMTSDGSGIRAQSYGTGDKMHGPAITKELPKALQDFEINTNFDIVSRRPEDNFRMEVYFLDENMNMLGKMGIKDNNRADKKRMALGRVGAYKGGGESNGYVIGQHNYNRIIKTDTTLFNLYVKREGKLFTFYVGRWRNKKHEWVAKQTYLDVAGEYAGKLKFVTLFIGNYKDRTVPTRLRINNVEVFELKQLTVDQTPYILRAGDELIIDHESEGVFINGINAMPLKHFGSDFFELPNGYSSINIHPDDSFEGTVRYRERYK